MRIKAQYPIVACQNMADSCDFYTTLGFIPLFESRHYTQLIWPEDRTVQLRLLCADRQSAHPLYLTEYRGGLFLGFEVDDVDALYASMRSKGLDVLVHLTDAPWGQRRFTVMDPNGVALEFSTVLPEARTEFADAFRATLAAAA